MSKHCCLLKPKGVKRFSEAAEKKFVDICANGATILKVKGSPFRPGEAAEVDVFVNGKNIASELIPLCKPFKDHIDSVSNDSGIAMSQNGKI